MTDLKNLTLQLQVVASYTIADRNPSRPVLVIRWTIDRASGRPVGRWAISRPNAVIEWVPASGAPIRGP